jgi:hypothetical protein
MKRKTAGHQIGVAKRHGVQSRLMLLRNPDAQSGGWGSMHSDFSRLGNRYFWGVPFRLATATIVGDLFHILVEQQFQSTGVKSDSKTNTAANPTTASVFERFRIDTSNSHAP